VYGVCHAVFLPLMCQSRSARGRHSPVLYFSRQAAALGLNASAQSKTRKNFGGSITPLLHGHSPWLWLYQFMATARSNGIPYPHTLVPGSQYVGGVWCDHDDTFGALVMEHSTYWASVIQYGLHMSKISQYKDRQGATPFIGIATTSNGYQMSQICM
jgi:hypothetical protein